MIPPNGPQARDLLESLGAPPRLLRHIELVGEAGEELLAGLATFGLALDADFVRAGIVLHDAGKIRHPVELHHSGILHQPAGEAFLLEHGVTPALARVCLSHARWKEIPDVSLEELVIALADKLWKGIRKTELEEFFVQSVAEHLQKPRWDVFMSLDKLFESIADQGNERLARSRV